MAMRSQQQSKPPQGNAAQPKQQSQVPQGNDAELQYRMATSGGTLGHLGGQNYGSPFGKR